MVTEIKLVLKFMEVADRDVASHKEAVSRDMGRYWGPKLS